MIRRAPRIKKHPDHPATGGLHRRRRLGPRAAQSLQGDARLLHGERQIRVADSCQLRAQCGRQHRGTQCAAADQNEPHARWAIAHDRADHLPRRRRSVQPLQIIKNKHDLGVGGRVDEQARRLGMGDAGGQRAGGYPAHRGQLLRERLLQVGHQPSRGGVGGIDAQPGHRPIEPAAGVGHRHRLAGPGGGCDRHDPVGIHQLAEQPIKALTRR